MNDVIYCVEDDRGIRELIVYTLQNTGFETIGFERGETLMPALRQRLPDLLLLDLMLPGEDGISILNRLRSQEATKKLPVIILTAKGTEYDKVIGLDSGADDYITKPFGMMELISRVKAVLRRTATEAQSEMQQYHIGEIELDVRSHRVRVAGQPVELTMKEFELLQMLLQHAGAVLSRNQLLEKIWGYDFDGETRTVDVHIRTLRQKLGESSALIETVRGLGYRIGVHK